MLRSYVFLGTSSFFLMRRPLNFLSELISTFLMPAFLFCSLNFQHIVDATRLNFFQNFQHFLDFTAGLSFLLGLPTRSWRFFPNFQRVLDATKLSETLLVFFPSVFGMSFWLYNESCFVFQPPRAEHAGTHAYPGILNTLRTLKFCCQIYPEVPGSFGADRILGTIDLGMQPTATSCIPELKELNDK